MCYSTRHPQFYEGISWQCINHKQLGRSIPYPDCICVQACFLKLISVPLAVDKLYISMSISVYMNVCMCTSSCIHKAKLYYVDKLNKFCFCCMQINYMYFCCFDVILLLVDLHINQIKIWLFNAEINLDFGDVVD